MNKIIKYTFLILFLVSIIMAFLVVINVMAEIKYANYGEIVIKNGSEFRYIAGEEVGINNVMSISVKKPRWYGTIIEDVGEQGRNIEILYLFNQIKLPIKVNEKSWLWMYWIALAIFGWFIIILITIKLLKKKEVERGYDEHGWRKEERYFQE